MSNNKLSDNPSLNKFRKIARKSVRNKLQGHTNKSKGQQYSDTKVANAQFEANSSHHAALEQVEWGQHYSQPNTPVKLREKRERNRSKRRRSGFFKNKNFEIYKPSDGDEGILRRRSSHSDIFALTKDLRERY